MVKKITGVFTTLDAEGNEVELYPEGTLGSDNSVTLTRAEYDALSDKEKDSDTTYYISDEDAQPNAFSVPFTSDKYTASNTGDALIEVKTKLEETNSNLNSCFQSVSNGKTLIASAITDKGISTDATASFDMMATNIASISGDAEYTARLYNALQYSGIVTSTMTFDQMCAALFAKYPNKITVLSNGSPTSGYTQNVGRYNTVNGSISGFSNMFFQDTDRASGYVYAYINPAIDLTPFKIITFQMQITSELHTDCGHTHYFYAGVNKRNNGGLSNYVSNAYNKNVNTYTLNVSSLSGEYYIGAMIGGTCGTVGKVISIVLST